MIKILSYTFLILIFNANAKLLDKVAGVINDKVYTLSDLEDIKSTMPARKEIAGFVYNKKSYDLDAIFNHLRNKYIIKSALSEQGIIINDERVEEQIDQTRKRLGIDQTTLVRSLKERGLNFEQYFELTREITEYNVFNRNIIAPLVNVTEQEIKNVFYKRSDKKNALSFKYYLIDYSINSKSLNPLQVKTLKNDLEKYKESGILPGRLRNLETNDIGDVSDEDLPKDIKVVLRNSTENSFTDPVLKGDSFHLFFIKKKELSESSEYLQAKNNIYAELFMDRSEKITNAWFNREALSYYILKNI